MPPVETVLVTGGAGFIGTHLSRALVRAGHRVLSVDLKGTPEVTVAGVSCFLGDVRDVPTSLSLIQTHGVTAVYHLAATVSVPLCQNDPLESYSQNVGATLAVLEACRQASITREQPIRFAFASSAALYGRQGEDGAPLAEERVAPSFQSFYAAQKHASEKIIELYCITYGIPTLIFRFFNVFGPGQDPTSPYSGVITIFSRLARENHDLRLDNQGIQTRDFVAVSDLAEVLTNALRLPEAAWNAQPFNLGSGVATSIRQLARMVVTLCNSRSDLIDAPPRPGDILHSLADISRARKVLSFEPHAALSAGLEALLK